MDELTDEKNDPLRPAMPLLPTMPKPTGYMVCKLLDFPKTKIRLIVSKHADYSSII